MSKNPFVDLFDEEIEIAESLSANTWARYSNIVTNFDTTELPEEPEDSFREEAQVIRFDEEIWTTEDH